MGTMGGWREERERGVKDETEKVGRNLVVKDLAKEFELVP